MFSCGSNDSAGSIVNTAAAAKKIKLGSGSAKMSA